MGYLKYYIIFIMSFVFAVLLTPACGAIAVKLGIMDKPDKNLKKHKKPVPYLGGVAIFLAFILTLVIQRLYEAHTLKGLIGILAGSSMIFALGLVDDLKKLSVPFKFSIQICAALILLLTGIKINFLGNEVLNSIVTVFWVVGVTNAFNLLDIMDGLCAGSAAIISLVFFVIGIYAGHLFSPLAALALSGGALGYLIYNFPPARIFMGDAGSLFIGFLLSSLAMTESYSMTNNLAVLLPVVILMVPIFDTLFVMWVRWKLHKPVYYGSPDHFPLRLLKKGLSVRQVLLIVYSINVLLGIISFFIIKGSTLVSAVIYVFLLVISLFLARYLFKIT